MEQAFFPVTRREAERQGIPFSSTANRNALFPSQLRELRKEKGISQAALAKALRVSKSTVGLWETGDTLPDAKSLHDVAAFFDVSANYLLGFTNDMGMIQTATEELGLSHDAVTEIKNLGSGNMKVAFDNFICDPDFMVFIYSLAEIRRASKIIYEHENDTKDTSVESIREYDEINSVSDDGTMVLQGEIILDLLKLKLDDVLNEMIFGIVNAYKYSNESGELSR